MIGEVHKRANENNAFQGVSFSVAILIQNSCLGKDHFGGVTGGPRRMLSGPGSGVLSTGLGVRWELNTRSPSVQTQGEFCRTRSSLSICALISACSCTASCLRDLQRGCVSQILLWLWFLPSYQEKSTLLCMHACRLLGTSHDINVHFTQRTGFSFY